MRFTSSIVFAAGTVLAVIACSSSSDSSPPAQVSPDGGGGSSGGSSGDVGGSSGTSTSGGTDGGTEAAATVWVTTKTETMQHEGSARTYIVSVPVDYDQNKSYPLYIWLHGNPGNAQSAATFAVHNVTKNEAIILYPGAISGDGWDHYAAIADNVDSTFIFAAIDAVKAAYSIDANRILLSGWSGGGFMASAMACRFSGSFRAIGVHAGGAPYDYNTDVPPDCDGAAIATLVTHGENDVSAGGGVDFASGEYAAQYWSEHNGCQATTAGSTPAPCETYAGCPADKPVKRCFIAGLGHPLWAQALQTEWDWFKALP